MTYKMIVLDLDDTLLRDDHTISPRTKEALMAAQKNGVKVVLASGRPTYAMWELAAELHLADYGSFILSFNGGKITDCQTKRDVLSCTLSPETVHHLFDVSKREDVHILTYVGDNIITDETSEYIEIEANLTGMPLVIADDFKQAISVPVVKTMMLDNPEKLVLVEKKLQKEFDGKLSIARSKPFFLEITENGIDKGKSLAKLISHLDIKQEEVIAIGDGHNDVTMIEFAGLGVAMDNADDDIKAKADYITDSNMNDGVAKVVEEFVLSKVMTQ